jgi:branched-chain amino acid transport system permease protein
VSDIPFEPLNNVVLFLFAVVGGVTTISGAFLGGALFALLPFVQSEYPEQAGLVFAVVALAAISLGRQPNGIAGLVYGWFADRVGGPARRTAPGVDAGAGAGERVGEDPTMEIDLAGAAPGASEGGLHARA